MRQPWLVTAFALAVAASTAAGTPGTGLRPSGGSGPWGPGARPRADRVLPLASTASTGKPLPRASATQLPPPRHRGTLRVTGDLRDGGTVAAAGLSWRA